LKVIDLSQRLHKYGDARPIEDLNIDSRWASKVTELFQDIYKTERKFKLAQRYYSKAIYPVVKYMNATHNTRCDSMSLGSSPNTRLSEISPYNESLLNQIQKP
jgi:hypothetical protein